MEFAIETIISLVAIGLSIAFYLTGKKAEKTATELLSKTKEQVDNLQKISERWLDKSIDYFTGLKPPITEMKDFVKELSGMMNIDSNKPINNQLKDKLITSTIATYMFTAKTNFWAQCAYIFSLKDNQKSGHISFKEEIKNDLNLSYTSFSILRVAIETIPEIKHNELYPYYKKIQGDWTSVLKNYEMLCNELK